MSKINIYEIIKKHIKSQFTGFGDLIIFIGLPLITAILLTKNEIFVSEQVSVLVSSLAIFIGLFFNAIVILFDILGKGVRVLKKRLLEELLSNITFSIFQSVVIILCLIATRAESYSVKIIFNFLAYFLLCWFLLNLIMILKRMYKIFIDEVNQS